MRVFHLVTGIVAVVLGAGLVVGLVALFADPSAKWAQGGASAWDFAWVTALGLLFVWMGIRLVRVGVRISGEKLTNRGYLVTRTVKASEICAIALRPKRDTKGGLRWTPLVVVASGKSFWIDSFDCGPAEKPPASHLAAKVEAVRVLLGVEATGISPPAGRQADGAAG
jgi:hypothetical protein